MKLSKVLPILILVLALPLLSVGAANAQNQQPATIMVSNSTNAALTLVIDGNSYTVGANGGQVAFAVTPGTHQYTATVAGSPSVSGSIDLAATQTFSIAAHIGQFGQVFDANGNEIDQSTYPSMVVFVEQTWGPGGTKLPVQNPTNGLGAVVFDNTMNSDVPMVLGHDFQVTLPANGRLELILPATQVRYTASGNLSSWQSTNNGVANLLAGQVTGLQLTANYNASLHLSSSEKNRVRETNASPWQLEVTPMPGLPIVRR
jgi:hypothetical protein